MPRFPAALTKIARRAVLTAAGWLVLSGPVLAQAHGVVSSASPEATAAGVEILEAGGNAIDAAVAVSIALGITEPAGSGIGGQTQIIVHPPGGAPFVINGTSFSPAATPTTASRRQLTYGRTASTVPSTLKVLDFAQRQFGSGRISWAQALAPAIRYADDGFAVSGFRYRSLVRSQDELAADATAAALYLAEDGRAAPEGARLRQPTMARTLRRLARDGAQDFYTGAIAREIAEDMAANGGWITADDLARTPDPLVQPALHARYRGHDVHTLPSPAGGRSVLTALAELESAPAEDLARSGATSRTLWLLRALNVAHAQRADPSEAAGETTHFSVVDADGMAVSVTQSIDSYFGARVAHPTLGFLYNNYMQTFEVNSRGRPFALGPNKPPFSSMSATIVARDGRPVLVLGSPGSARIISAVTQVLSHWVDVEPDIEAATAAPRVHVTLPATAYLEQSILDPKLLSALGEAGFRLRRQAFGLSDTGLDPYFGGIHAIAREGADGGWRGAADPRRDGTVGYARAEVP